MLSELGEHKKCPPNSKRLLSAVIFQVTVPLMIYLPTHTGANIKKLRETDVLRSEPKIDFSKLFHGQFDV